MRLDLLQEAIDSIKKNMENVITTGKYNGKSYRNGHSAKEGYIRSSQLILMIHEVVKRSIFDQYLSQDFEVDVFPPIGYGKPELKVHGLIKSKNQDLVFMPKAIPSEPGRFAEGPLEGKLDKFGKRKIESSLIVGIRSQLSSVDKNFDTLMERTFAETLNLRLRMPKLIMGEVYLLPVHEYDEKLMRHNQVGWKRKQTKIEKFIKIFQAFSGRKKLGTDVFNIYKYERSALILVDFSKSSPKIYLSKKDLVDDGIIPSISAVDYDKLSPKGFAEEITSIHLENYSSIE